MNMVSRILFTVFIGFTLTTSLYGQKPLKEYKILADASVAQYFSKSVFKAIRCKSYFDQGKELGKGSGSYYDDSIGNRILHDPQYTLIFYELYSKELDYTFYFFVVIDSNMIVQTPISGLDNIPQCVRKNKMCHFISRQKAIDIAKKASIQYPDNLRVELKKPKASKESYWVVSGQDKRNVDYNEPEPEDGWNIFPYKKENTRYINALTGKVLNYEQYLHLDKEQ